jgi:hypothetical protein
MGFQQQREFEQIANGRRFTLLGVAVILRNSRKKNAFKQE